MPRDVSLSDSKCWNGGHEWLITEIRPIKARHFWCVACGINVTAFLGFFSSLSDAQPTERVAPLGITGAQLWVLLNHIKEALYGAPIMPKAPRLSDGR